MRNLLKKLRDNIVGVQSTLFLIFAILSAFTLNPNRFWMFIIASIVFGALDTIIEELRKLNAKR